MSKYLVYLITNTVNGKIYVGRTRTTLLKRWNVHKSHARYGEKYTKTSGKRVGQSYLYNSMRKHGVENFKIEIIYEAKDNRDMVESEARLIKSYRSNDFTVGYNLVIDKYDKGSGLEFMSQEFREKRSKSTRINRYNYPTGVIWDRHRNKWKVCINYLDKKIIKRVDNETEAKKMADRIRLYWFGSETPIYFPENLQEYLAEDLKKYVTELEFKKPTKLKSTGVNFVNNEFLARITTKSNKRIYIGTYRTELEAALAYDKVCVYLNKNTRLNHPDMVNDAYFNEGERIFLTYSNPKRQIIRKNGKTSKYNGVSLRSVGTWDMCLIINKVRYREHFRTEIEAARAHDILIRKYNGNLNRLNFPDEVIADKSECIPIAQ